MPHLDSAKYIRRWVEECRSSHDPNTKAIPLEQCLTALKSVGIQTDYDLIIRFDVLPETPAPLHRHIKALRMAVLERFASPGRTAAGILVSSRNTTLNADGGSPSYIKSGMDALDDLLGGGLRIGHVTELCGRSGSGKTQLTIEFAASHLLSTNSQYCDSKVYYLQSSPLPLWRVEDVLKARLGVYDPSSDSDELLQKAMDRLVIVDCYSNESLLSFLYDYSANLSCGTNGSGNEASSDLVIVDSIRPLVINASDAYNNRYILIHAIRTALRGICTASQHLRSATVLITNGISQRGPFYFNNHTEAHKPSSTAPAWPLNIQPSLGASWAQISHTHIFLSPEDCLSQESDNTGTFDDGSIDSAKQQHCKTRAMILKSTHLPSAKSCLFSIR